MLSIDYVDQSKDQGIFLQEKLGCSSRWGRISKLFGSREWNVSELSIVLFLGSAALLRGTWLWGAGKY